MKKKKSKLNRGVGYWIFIFCVLIPPLINLIFNWIICSFENIRLAFTDLNDAFSLENFKTFFTELFLGDSKEALTNTFLFYCLSTFIIMPLGYFIAYFIYKRIAGYKVFRVIFFLPSILPGVAMTTAFKEVVKNDAVLGLICAKLGVELPALGVLNTPDTAIWFVILYTFIFGATGGVMVAVGTMSRISDSLLEYAKLDGCNAWNEFTQIVIPLMFPLILLSLLTSVTGFFGASGPLLLLTNGENGTMTVSYWITKKILFEGTNAYHLAAAANLSLGLLILPVALIVRRLMVKLPSVEF